MTVAAGLVKLGHVALDGSKMKANAWPCRRHLTAFEVELRAPRSITG